MYKLFSSLIPKSCLLALKHNSFVVKTVQLLFQKTFPFPKVVQIHTTSSCNLSCNYCYSKHKHTSPIDWMSVLEQSSRMRVKCIEFMGGEPFMDPSLKKYLSFCAKSNLKIKIYTNGLLLTKEWIRFLATLRSQLIIVFKFDRIDLLEKVIGENQFDLLASNIEKCVSASIRCHAHVIVNKKNYHSINEIISLAQEHQLIITSERYMPMGTDQANEELTINTSQWNTALSQLNLHYNQFGSSYQINSIIKGNTCSCYVDLLSIDVDGFVKPCPFALKEQAFGSVANESLRDLWKKFTSLRKTWGKIPDKCLSCKHQLLCHGGCKTYTFLKHRSYNFKDPLCNRDQIPTSIYSDQFINKNK